MAVGGATAGTGGIAFPATAVAVADANTLDDYEEGTWTPSLGGSATYNAQAGTYTKIGRQVTVTGSLFTNILGTGSATTISGLPFSSASASNASAVGYWSNTATNIVFLSAQASTTTLNLFSATAAAAALGSNNIFQDATQIIFTATYFV
jgi:hypothetical protein